MKRDVCVTYKLLSRMHVASKVEFTEITSVLIFDGTFLGFESRNLREVLKTRLTFYNLPGEYVFVIQVLSSFVEIPRTLSFLLLTPLVKRDT